MASFDQIFDPDYTAVDLFTNRAQESTVFENSLLSHFERVLDGRATLNRRERQNVLTFYGVGGIGKTELSQRLERWLLNDLPETDEWGPPPGFDHQVRTFRVDFHGNRAIDVASIILRLRAAVADSRRRFPAFDIGFATWWALAHPGTPLPDLRNASGFDVKGQINDTVTDLLNEVGARIGIGPLTVRTGSQLIEIVRSRVVHSKALRACAPLEAVVEHARIDPSQYVAASLAGLLSWDLERVLPHDRPLVVAFADAAEYVLGGDRGSERLLNRIVHLTPMVLWTITSRSSLDWDTLTPASMLPATGPRIWPSLSLGRQDEPRQHLVGDLSDEDVDRYLSMASGRAGVPELGPEIIERIHRGAHGLPIYLDMSLSIARSAGAGALDPAAFGGPLPELVTRVFADLPEEQRDIARTAGLLPRFDAEILAAATGRLVGDAVRFCRRSLVSHDDHALFPARLHDVVRTAIVGESVHDPGAWTEADRRARSQALADALHARHAVVMDDIELRLEILTLVAHLCGEYDAQAPWLLQALVELPGFQRIAERFPRFGPDRWIGQVAEFFEAFHGTTIAERITRLEESRAHRNLSRDVDDTTRRWLAYSYRGLDNYPPALEILRDLLGENPDSELERYQFARTLRLAGHYDELQRYMTGRPLSGSYELRMRSDLAFDYGHLTESIAGVAARASYLRAVGRHRVALENEVTLLWRSVLAGRGTVAECDAVIAETERYAMIPILRTSLGAKALCLRADRETARAVLAESRVVSSATGSEIGWRVWTPALLCALRCGDHAHIEELRDEWNSAHKIWTPNIQIVDRLFAFIGYPPTFQPVATSGDDSATEIDSRWRAIFATLVNG